MAGRVVVTGAAGQLGRATVEALASAYSVVPLSRAEVDITNAAALRAAVLAAAPEILINCTAYNDVDGAEDNAERAFAVNAFAVRTLAHTARELDALFVHYGTDFVFDGVTTRPYTEDDPPSPQCVYAQSKLVGEWFAADAPRHYILRVESLFGGPSVRSSIDRIIAAIRSGQEARVFHDREVSPSFVDDVVTATRALIDRQAPSGVYHCVNSGHTTWLELAKEIVRLMGTAQARLVPVSVSDVKLRAPRPQYAALDNSKLARAAFHMPTWQDALQRYLAGTRSA
jgi:dTDP-4-dehydrorhamnose reductase